MNVVCLQTVNVGHSTAVSDSASGKDSVVHYNVLVVIHDIVLYLQFELRSHLFVAQ